MYIGFVSLKIVVDSTGGFPNAIFGEGWMNGLLSHFSISFVHFKKFAAQYL